jgi:site-specific recombinase XerD
VAHNVAAATQNQAKSAILFVYRDVLGIELQWLTEIVPAKVPTHLPIVLTRPEVEQVLERLRGIHHLIGSLLYGTGMRIMEAMRLRIGGVDFSRREIVVRNGKGAKDRVTILPRSVERALLAHLRDVRAIYDRDVAAGRGSVHLPHALARKYPNAAREWCWQYVFPAPCPSIDPR